MEAWNGRSHARGLPRRMRSFVVTIWSPIPCGRSHDTARKPPRTLNNQYQDLIEKAGGLAGFDQREDRGTESLGVLSHSREKIRAIFNGRTEKTE